jgi:predicted Zn-dependent protease
LLPFVYGIDISGNQRPDQNLSESDVDGKIELYSRLIDEVPSDPAYHMKLAAVFSRIADMNQAIGVWTSLVERHPEEWRLQTQLANSLSTKRSLGRSEQHIIEDDVQIWKRLVAQHPSVWSLKDQLTKAFSRNGDIDEEIEGWVDLVHHHPKHWQIDLAQAYSRKRRGMTTGLMECLEDEIRCWARLVDETPEE